MRDDHRNSRRPIPDFATLNPGYKKRRERKRMQMLLRACGAALTLALLCCQSASAQQLTPYRVGISDAVNTVLPVWMAQEGGFYAANGLAVEVINMGGGSRGAKELQAGKIDLMRVGMSSVVQANQSGGDLRLIASMSNV